VEQSGGWLVVSVDKNVDSLDTDIVAGTDTGLETVPESVAAVLDWAELVEEIEKVQEPVAGRNVEVAGEGIVDTDAGVGNNVAENKDTDNVTDTVNNFDVVNNLDMERGVQLRVLDLLQLGKRNFVVVWEDKQQKTSSKVL